MSPSHGNGNTNGGGAATGAAAAASAAAKSSHLSSASDDIKTSTTTTETSWGVGGQRVKRGLPEMLKGGVIMDVTTPDEAKIAESAGACAVMALEKIPSDIRKEGGVARMSDPMMIESIQKAVSIPVMAKCRIGHFVEAEILQAVGVDCIDESEVLTTADEEFHIEKSAEQFTIPFVCGCRNLGEALRRINEGASMIRTKGEAGTGNIVEAVRHIRAVKSEIARLASKNSSYSFGEFALRNNVPKELVVSTVRSGRLPVVTFAAGGIATPADAVMCMKLGMDGVFVGSGIFRSEDPQRRAEAIVKAVTFYNDSKKVMEVSKGLGGAMAGVSTAELREQWAKRESGSSSSSSSAEDGKGSLMMKPLKITG